MMHRFYDVFPSKDVPRVGEDIMETAAWAYLVVVDDGNVSEAVHVANTRYNKSFGMWGGMATVNMY